jgi:hypothetical protein
MRDILKLLNDRSPEASRPCARTGETLAAAERAHRQSLPRQRPASEQQAGHRPNPRSARLPTTKIRDTPRVQNA